MTVPVGLRVVVHRLFVREGHSPVVAGIDRYSELLQRHLRSRGHHRRDYSRHRAYRQEPIDDSGTCLLFVTHLSNHVKILFALLTSDEGKVDH